MYQWTVYCKLPDDRRGEYSEEIDVATKTRSRAAALRKARELIEQEYDLELRPVRVVLRPAGMWW